MYGSSWFIFLFCFFFQGKFTIIKTTTTNKQTWNGLQTQVHQNSEQVSNTEAMDNKMP